jgi:Dyp-type peroxidase family
MTYGGTTTAQGAQTGRTEPGLPLRESREIQGDIVAGFKKDHTQLLFLRFGDGPLARQWLRRLRPRIATTRQVATFNAEFSRARKASRGDDPRHLTALWRGVSFTYPGLLVLTDNKEIFTTKALEEKTAEDPGQVDNTLKAFVEGAECRAAVLGDTGDNSPESWLFGNGINGRGGQTVHAVLTVAADRPEDLRAALGQERQEAATHKIVIVYEQDGATLQGSRRGKEHFGFKDGVSEPAVEGFDERDPANPEYAKGKPGTRVIPTGELIIGEKRADGSTAGLPGWMNNGSFQVVRRLGQDVPGWWAQVGAQLKVLKQAKKAPPEATVEWLAARLVGRWRTGTPIAKCPHADAPTDAEAGSDNDIRFRDDPEGEITPLWSHLRKTNPRDGLRFRPGEDLVPEKPFMDMRRIMRRGTPYGQPFDPAGGEGNGPDASRGLVFVCYQADLVQQFEFIQRSWINNLNFPDRRQDPEQLPERGPHVGSDGMMGADHPKRDLQLPAGTEVTFRDTPLRFEQFVRTEGAVYAFAPSMSALALLADGKLTGPGNGETGTVVITAPFTFQPDTPVGTHKAKLLLRSDGDLVVVDENQQVRWSSGTARSGGVRAVFETGGDLVIQNDSGSPLWKAGTGGSPGNRLILREDGDVLIEAADGGVLFRTNTQH